MGAQGFTEPTLAGRSILIVEDEWIITTLLEHILGDMGCRVAGAASHVDEAADKLSSLSFDAAILDVNLNGEPTYPLAEMLRHKGKPFVFATGYGPANVPSALHDVPVIVKPFNQRDLIRALKAVL